MSQFHYGMIQIIYKDCIQQTKLKVSIPENIKRKECVALSPQSSQPGCTMLQQKSHLPSAPKRNAGCTEGVEDSSVHGTQQLQQLVRTEESGSHAGHLHQWPPHGWPSHLHHHRTPASFGEEGRMRCAHSAPPEGPAPLDCGSAVGA